MNLWVYGFMNFIRREAPACAEGGQAD
jgi:hypothetical protein